MKAIEKITFWGCLGFIVIIMCLVIIFGIWLGCNSEKIESKVEPIKIISNPFTWTNERIDNRIGEIYLINFPFTEDRSFGPSRQIRIFALRNELMILLHIKAERLVK